MRSKAGHLRVVHRLGLTFGALSLIVALICATAVWNSLHIRQLVDHDVSRSQQDWAEATQLDQQVQRLEIAIRNVGLNSVPAEMRKQAETASAAGAEAAKTLDGLLLRGHGPKEQELLETIRKLSEQARPIEAKTVSLAETFMQDDATKLITERLEPISAHRATALREFAALQHQRASDATEEITRVARSSSWVILACGGCGLLFAGISSWLVARSIVQPLKDAVVLANAVADGDLSRTMPAGAQDEIGDLTRALGRMSTNLRNLIEAMRGTARSVLVASTEIASGNQDLSARTELQASHLQETAATVSQMAQAVGENSDSTRAANDLATQAASVAAAAGNKVTEVSATMSDIANSSKRMSDIVGVIDGIAFQTNILALNAAVEAARAGENGRGFSVVAAEVRTLSQRSAEAAREIKSLISTNMTRVESGLGQALAAGSTMSDVVTTSRRAAEIIARITAMTEDQAAGLAKVDRAVRTIDNMTQQNSALVEEAAAAAASLENQTRGLTTAVSAFKTET